MAEEEFEIDVYGDSGTEPGDHGHGEDHGYDAEDAHHINGDDRHHDHYHEDSRQDNMDDGGADQIESNGVAPQRPQQGVKRKEGSDERPVDPGATTALMISELNWWNTDDDIRGWVNQAGCEHELKDITFSEHKINGKSKGQAYVEFTSQQAATATKHRIDALSNEYSQPGQQKRHTVIYSGPAHNPFRTLPKDAPNRAAKDGQSRAAPGPVYNDRGGSFGGSNNFGGFRGGRGGFNGPRGGGGGMNQGGFNRNFAGNNMNSFGSNNMGFNNPMGGVGYGGGFNRGGMMGGGMRGGGMRGGRGGGMNMMGGMPMGGAMPMGGMGGPMGGMGMMGGGMGAGMPGFQGMQPGFNPGFFGGGAGNQSNEWQNPHGAKRARGE